MNRTMHGISSGARALGQAAKEADVFASVTAGDEDNLAACQLAKAAFGQSFIGEAPVVIAACGTEPKAIMACGQPTYTVDVSIACAFMILQAYELGLGTCWIGAFKEDEVKKILKIPEPIRVVALIPLGYPDEDPSQRARKDSDEIICLEKFE